MSVHCLIKISGLYGICHYNINITSGGNCYYKIHITLFAYFCLHFRYRLYAYTKNEPNHFVAFLLHPPHRYDGTTHDRITPLIHITTMSDTNVSHVVYVLDECN